MLDALRFTTDVRSILQRNRIVNNFGHYWPDSEPAKKWSLPWLPTLQQNFQSYNGMATYYPRNWKSTLKYFTVLHHCKTIFKKFEIFTGAILSLFSFLSARQYCVIKNSEQQYLWFLTVFIPEWNNGLDRRANIIHWIWFWLYRWERLLHSKCLPRVIFWKIHFICQELITRRPVGRFW